jgi:hypothetical protein
MTPLSVTTLPAEAGASGDATAARGATMVLMRRFEDACFGMFAEVILQEVVKLRIQKFFECAYKKKDWLSSTKSLVCSISMRHIIARFS